MNSHRHVRLDMDLLLSSPLGSFSCCLGLESLLLRIRSLLLGLCLLVLRRLLVGLQLSNLSLVLFNQ